MSTHVIEPRVGVFARLPAAARKQLPWLLSALVGGFLVPFVLADRLNLPKDVYYGLYGVMFDGG